MKMNHDTTDAGGIRLAGRLFTTFRRGSRLVRALFYARLRLHRWCVEKRAIRHLESLDDHRLDDLGIERSQIRAAVRGRLERQEISRRPGDAPRATGAGHRLAA
jgi:uncharacterized protein YjiS (DUF1127 family)